MSGRQSHGRPLLASSVPRNSKKSKSKGRSKALDAFALAQEQVPDTTKGVRKRGLEPEAVDRSHKKHRRDEEEDEGDGGDGDDGAGDLSGGPQKKRARNDNDSFDGLSDSDGNEWHIGVDGEDEDSEIDSDDAFGEGDEEKFEDFTFRGSSSKDVRGDGDDGSDADDGESLGSDAIDLAQALDQVSDDEESEAGSGSGSEDEDESSAGSESDEGDEEDPAQREALRKLVSGFAGGEEDGDEAQSTSQQRPKIGLKDLGLFGVKDPDIKKSLKLMNKEEKATTRGTSRKLDVPLARRQQDKLLRSAAYEKTSETLNRWTDTVKHNRRADHLLFPLAQNKQDAGLDNRDLLPLDKKSSSTELEQTIMAIMEESGLGPSSKAKEDKDAGDGNGQDPSVSRDELKELWNQRRRDRELQSRELARAKRIKKIKSKAYRRVHRKENLRDEMAAKEAMAEAGEIDSEEEREAHDRRRAMERMGSKHKESKWAKMGSNARRAVWDEDFRAGLTDMARMDAELRRRVEGKTKGSDDEHDDESDASADSGDDGGKDRLLNQLDREAEDEPTPKSGLAGMKFMQRGEEVLKKANDELVKQIRRDLASDGEEEDEEDEEVDIGRRQYGMTKSNATKAPNADQNNREKPASTANASLSNSSRPQLRDSASALSQSITEHQSSGLGGAGAWSRAGSGHERRKNRKASNNKAEELDLSNAAVLATKRTKPSQQAAKGQATGDSSEDEDTVHLPMAIKDQELIKRAFAGEDVVGEFEREKGELVAEDESKTIDNTLPGWGSWVGEGVSNKDKKRHTGRFLTKVDGVKTKDRKDFKLDRVIVSEKRLRKNDKYLASQLPYPFESRLQYERSLRLPVGPDWMTKETFQDSTKPRVIVKPGVIAPMTKPMV